MNPYLTKIASLTKEALNALKARQMAAKVGVIPVPGSQFKYALRKLRDTRGNPLQGRELSEARQKLGDISNNTYQEISSLDRLHGSRGIELTSRVGSGKLLNTPAIGGLGGVDRGLLNRGGDNLHTHPFSNTHMPLHIREGIARRHSLASPSGLLAGRDFVEKARRISLSPEYRALKADLQSKSLKRVYESEQLSKMRNTPGLDHDSIEEIDDMIRQHNSTRAFDASLDMQGRFKPLSSLSTPAAGDIAVLLRKTHLIGQSGSPGRSRASETIVAPSVGHVSSTVATEYNPEKTRLRTIYFDHSPRKTR